MTTIGRTATPPTAPLWGPDRDLAFVQPPLDEEDSQQDLALVNQSLRHLTLEGIRNQDRVIDNVALLFAAIQQYDALFETQAQRLTLIEEQLRTEKRQKREAARSFANYEKTSHATIEAQTERIEGLIDDLREANAQIESLEEKVNRLDQRYTGHSHQITQVPTCYSHANPAHTNLPKDGEIPKAYGAEDGEGRCTIQ